MSSIRICLSLLLLAGTFVLNVQYLYSTIIYGQTNMPEFTKVYFIKDKLPLFESRDLYLIQLMF